MYTHDDNYYHVIYTTRRIPLDRYYNVIIVGRSVDEPTMAYGKRYGKYLLSKKCIYREDACRVLQLLLCDVDFESPLMGG